MQVMDAFAGEGTGAYLRVTDGAGTVLAQTEKLAEKEGWVRLVAPFALATAATVQVQLLADGSGTFQANAAQLENGVCATAYNYLQNGRFEGTCDEWTGGTADTAQCFSGTQSLALTAETVDTACRAYQDIKPRMRAGDRETFTLSGWAKGCGLPPHDRGDCEDPHFCLCAEVVYTDDAIPAETFTAEFSPAVSDWQFAAVQFCKSHCATVKQIRVYCDYSFNSGTAYFDDLQLVRDTLETDLSVADFAVEGEEESIEVSEEAAETVLEDADVAEEIPAFEEAIDEHGNVLTETTFTDGEFGTIYRAFGFNPTGNDRVSEIDSRGNVTRFTVDAATSRTEEVTDRCGNKTAYEYDTAGRTTKVTSKAADGTEIANVSYAYDASDNLTAITRGDDMAYTLAYNPFRNLESIGVTGKANPLVRYTYKNGNGRLKSVTYANGDHMAAMYNGMGQLTAEKWYDANETLIAHYKYAYDNSGNIVRSIDILAAKEYTYIYEEGRLVRAAEADITFSGEIVTGKVVTHTVRYVYDNEGTLTKKVITPADGNSRTVYYETGDDSTVVKFNVGSGTVTSHSKCDAFGRKEFDELQLGAGFVSRRFIYHAGDVTDEHKANKKLKSSATTQLVSQIVLSDGRTLSYEYDAEERITKVIDSVDGTTAYTYDALGQLLTETVNGLLVNRMSYDSYGNILSKNGVQYTYGDTNWNDLLTAHNGQPITYDAQGNPTTYLGHTLTWEKGRQLKSFDGNTYTYNANGIRTSKTVGGIRHDYVLDGAKILRETWGENTLIPLYDNEDSVCGVLYDGRAFYFQKNLQGDIIAITDYTGETVARYTYDAWGVCTVASDTSGVSIAAVNPFRYRGYYYDAEIGMYYLQSRYYDPAIGRFVNADEAELVALDNAILHINLFAYVKNVPVDLTDSTGNAWYFSYNLRSYIPRIRDLKNIYRYITSVISDVKKNTKKALSSAKVYLEKVFLILKKKIKITKSALDQLIQIIKSLLKKLSRVSVKIMVALIVALVLMCKTSTQLTRNIWNWLSKTKVGQITWNAIMVLLSLAGLILSILGCGTPASAIAVAGIVVSAIALLGSVISLLMAIFS